MALMLKLRWTSVLSLSHFHFRLCFRFSVFVLIFYLSFKKTYIYTYFLNFCRGSGCGNGYWGQEEACSRKVIFKPYSVIIFMWIYILKPNLTLCVLSTSRKKAKNTEPKARKAKDPNARKRPPTAFFVFMYTSILYSCLFNEQE